MISKFVPLTLSLTALATVLSLPMAVSAQSSAQATPCPNGVKVIIDGVTTCRTTDTLDSLIEDFEAAQLINDPISRGEKGDRAALRQLPDVSVEVGQASGLRTRNLLARHAALSTRAMDQQQKLNYDLLGYVLTEQQRLSPFNAERIPFLNDSGFFTAMSYVARQTKFESVDDYEAYAARLTQLPQYFSQNKTNMRLGMEQSFTASAEILPGVISVVKTLSEGPADEHSLYAPFKSYPDNFSDAEQARLAAFGEAAINSSVLPAFRDLLNFFEEDYLKAARQTPGIGTTEEGRAYYRALVRHFTTLDLSPGEVHELGLSEVARIRSEMDKIIKQVKFKGNFSQFLEFLRTDEQFYAKSEDELMMRAAWLAKQIDGQMPQYFGKLPRLPYGVMKVPDEMAPTYTTGRYWGGNPKQHRAGNYMVNTYDLKQRPLYNLPALTAHEGVPGHHQQIAISQELENVPDFRQSLYPNAFGEGWGLYSEKLAAEMGIYKTPYEQFGQLTYEMWRACRLVVDTGIHWKGWSREQAEACFFENSALAPHNIKTEVERYISWPGQALAYKIGELKILELRDRAKTALGDTFSIRDFHDAVLEDGGIPLEILEAKIDRFIFDTQSNAASGSNPQKTP